MSESSYYWTGFVSYDGFANPINQVWQERKELEPFKNIERQAAYELRQEGHVQSIVFKQR